MNKKLIVLIFLITISLVITHSVAAQNEELTLRLSRDFGYGGFNNDIQGLFSMKVSGPDDLERVVFYIDSIIIGEVTKSPFNLQFTTDDYPLGQHNLHAIGFSSNGKEYTSNVIISNFVTASVGTKAGLKIAVPVLAIVFGAILISFIVPMIMGRGKNKNFPLGGERNYRFGGGICPKCKRPFTLPLFSLNLGLSKLGNCPYCGKWSVVRIQSLQNLREAERAELEWGRPEIPEETSEEKLKKELENSKFQAP
jgi:hypothetical protein